jgi:hypothetical protein
MKAMYDGGVNPIDRQSGASQKIQSKVIIFFNFK